MKTLCATRSTKVLKYLHRILPTTVARSSLQALETQPSSVLSSLHTVSDWNSLTKDEALIDWLKKNPIPTPKANVSGALFHGTLVFAKVIFRRADQPDFSLSDVDVRTAINYATLAVVPIQKYASQYGPNAVNVSYTIFETIAPLTGDSFTKDDLEGWVEQVAKDAREIQVTNPCVVVLHDRSLPATPMYKGQRNSYHSITGDGTPYCYCLVFGENLSVADNNHTIGNKTTDKVYAHILSHEIAEMVVDPLANVSNPEVCDACAGNCNNSLFSLFDQNGNYMGGTTDTASATGFTFFINSVIRPGLYDSATECVANGANPVDACVYPPPESVSLAVGDPAAYMFTAQGTEHVIFRAADNHLHELYSWATGGWYEHDITVEGAANADGDPAGYMFSAQGTQHAVYRGTDAHIHELYCDKDGWHHTDATGNSGAPDAAGDPAGYLFVLQGTQHVVYRGTDNHIHELWWDPSGWHHNDPTSDSGAPNAIGDPTGYVFAAQGTQHVIYRANDNHIHELWWDQSGWHHTDPANDSGAPDAIGDPASYVFDAQGTQHVMYRGTDSHIHELYWDTNGWHHTDASGSSGAPEATGDPAGYVFNAQGTQHVVYRAADNHIHELYSWATGEWQHHDPTGDNAAPDAVGNPAIFAFEAQSTQHIVYRGADNRIYELVWANGNWSHTQAS